LKLDSVKNKVRITAAISDADKQLFSLDIYKRSLRRDETFKEQALYDDLYIRSSQWWRDHLSGVDVVRGRVQHMILEYIRTNI
jgi:hypothetical protein